MKTGLILEGGAHRAIYGAGVLDVFLENNITFDGVIGVSAGAIYGCSYVSKQHRRSIEYTLKYAGNYRYMSWYSLLTTGNMVNEKFCYDELPNKLFPFDNETFKQSPSKFYVTCSNINTGKAEYIECRDMNKEIAYVRASASMPFVSTISKINNKEYLDGGICDSIPVTAFQNMGYNRCVTVQSRVEGYRKKPNKLAWLASIMYWKYPKFIEAIKKRHVMYNEQLAEIEKMSDEGKVFVIRPSRFIKIHHAEKDKKVLQQVYDLGREDAQKALPALKKFLEK